VSINENGNIAIANDIIIGGNFIKNGNNVIWKNVKEFLKISKRPPDHFLAFLRKESIYTINWHSESKSTGLTFNQKKIKNDFLIEKMKTYLNDYVICKSCKSINTYIEKDKQIRKYNFICVNCNNEYYI
jgi:translation initiation factor 2 subunit 2